MEPATKDSEKSFFSQVRAGEKALWEVLKLWKETLRETS